MKLYHAADIHLGRQRLDGHLPDQDFASAFRHIAEAAVADSAEVFLLAGDLFDRPQVEPRHLRQAQEVLQILYRAKIPVIAIEGNHDKSSLQSEDATWVSFLAEDGLVQLLRPQFGPEGPILREYDARKRQGCFIDYGGARFVGAGYLGAATPAKVRQMAAALNTAIPHVLILHAGPDYFVGEGGGFSKEDLAVLREKVTYLALGHIHKPMVHDGWACNPGSPENCDLREAGYCRGKDGAAVHRGYAVVEIDPAKPGKPTRLEIRSNPRRPVYRGEIDCTPFGSKKDGAAAFAKTAVTLIRQMEPEPTAAIDLRLMGCMNLNRIALDPVEVCAQLCREGGVHAVSLDVSQLNFGTQPAAEGAPGSEVSREELERQAIRQMAAAEPLCGLGEDPEAFAELFFDLKEAVRSGKEAQAFAELIASSPLVEKIRSAREVELAARAMMPAAAPAERQVGI